MTIKGCYQEMSKIDIFLSAREDAMFAAYLCSEQANCFVAQVFPVCGGWVGR